MTLTNEDLLAISQLLDKKLDARLKPIKNEVHSLKNNVSSVQAEMQYMKDDLHLVKLYQENIITPALNNIEACYTDTYNRYKDYADKMDAALDDIELLKKVVTEHSEKLQKIS